MCFAAVNGNRVYYETLGQGEPLLLSNGQGGDHHGWDMVRDAIMVAILAPGRDISGH